jgi:hypothetical protein
VSDQHQKDEVRGDQRARAKLLPDLQTQFEEIFVAVWRAEANWAFDDRLDMALSCRRAVSTKV